jgi:hypothetical protein
MLINVILDKSGSMHHLQRSTIDGFNSFLWDQQRQPGECRLSLTQFDTSFQIDHIAQDINIVPPLSTYTYMPSGGTALLDAVGTTIKNAEQWIAKNGTTVIRTMGAGQGMFRSAPVDWKVLTVVFTDGEENSSHQWHINQPTVSGDDRDIGGLIQWKQNEGWEFQFMGTGGSAWLEKTFKHVIPPDRFYSYAATNEAHTHSHNLLSSATSTYRGTGTYAGVSDTTDNVNQK